MIVAPRSIIHGRLKTEGDRMNKQELAAFVADELEITQSGGVRAVDAVLGSIRDALASGNPVTIVGFGRFDIAKSPARKGRNPQNGATIKVAARVRPTFKAGAGLKQAVQKQLRKLK